MQLCNGVCARELRRELSRECASVGPASESQDPREQASCNPSAREPEKGAQFYVPIYRSDVTRGWVPSSVAPHPA